MIYLENNQYKFYKNLVTFTENGITKTSYENDASSLMDMIYNNPRVFKYIKTDLIIPTKEQVDRLAEINNIALEFKENYTYDLGIYVKDGIMFNQDPSLKSLADKSKLNTAMFLIENIKPYIKELRDTKCDGGIKLYGFKFDSNEKARNNVSQYILIALKDKILSPQDFTANEKKYVWKDFDNIYRSLTFDQIKELADTMGWHMQACYAAEDITLVKLSKLTIEELLKFPINKKYNRTGRNIASEADVSVGDIPTVDPECPLKAIYEQSYIQALELVKAGK